MNFIKTYKYPLSISLALISVFFIFQNGTCSQTATTAASSSTTSSTSNKSTNTSTTLYVSLSKTSTTPGGTVVYTASGGTAPYYFTVLSGGGTFPSSTSGVYVAPNYGSTVTVGIQDSAGQSITSSALTVSAATLAITPTSSSVALNGTLQYSASGGTPPYTFYRVGSVGSINASSGLYTAGSISGTIQIEVVDSLSNTTLTSLTVGSGGSGGGTPPTTPFTASGLTVTVDHYFAVTYSNPSGSNYPTLTLFGTDPSYSAGANCRPLVNAVPCVQAISLTNFYNTNPYEFSYRGIISTSGRGGSGNILYCIDPSDTTKAYVALSNGPNFSMVARQFLSPGLVMFQGAVASTALMLLDKQTGESNYTSSVTGAYSVHTDCKDVGDATIQVQAW